MPALHLAALTRRLSEDPALEGAFVSAAPRLRLAFSAYAPGLLKGAMTHLDGPGRTEAALRALAEHPGIEAAWAEDRMTAYPPAFAQRGVDLARLLFVEGLDQFPWAATELIRSQVFPLVLVASPLSDARVLRRLQLAAERSACAVLLLAPLPEGAWPVRERLWCGWKDGALAVAGSDGRAIHDQAAVEA